MSAASMREQALAGVGRWRSMLFVPANASRERLEKAHLRGSDALILDLEDAVAPEAKAGARADLPSVVAGLAGRGAGVEIMVRVNAPLEAAIQDLPAAVWAHVRAIVVPKAEDPAHLEALSRAIGALEAERGLGDSGRRIAMVAMIESPAALALLSQFAAVERVVALALGSEDFSLALGVPPTPACLTLPCQMIAMAAASHGIMAIGLPGSVASFDDLDAYRDTVRLARAMGLTGALCIHPAQVPVINEAFSPSEDEYARAERIVAAWDSAAARGDAVIALDRRMIDHPIAARARMLLSGRTRR